MDIHIDRLRLQASGMDQDTARLFARLVAEHLGAALAAWPALGAEPPGSGGAGATRLGGLRVAARPGAWDNPDGLAAHTAAEISRALRSASTAETRTAPTRRPAGLGPAGEATT